MQKAAEYNLRCSPQTANDGCFEPYVFFVLHLDVGHIVWHLYKVTALYADAIIRCIKKETIKDAGKKKKGKSDIYKVGEISPCLW